MISTKQQKILAFPYSNYDVLICDGAVRSGKTSIMTVAFVDWAMANFNGQRFGICGRTVDSATKNIITPYTAMTYAQKRYTLKFKRQEKILEVRRGKTVNIFEVFGGKDEASASLIQGRTLAGVLLDEVVLMPESFVQQALARCSVDGSRIWFSCNPASPKHWFYQEWIMKTEEKNALYLHFAMTDNPSLSEKTLQKYMTYYPEGVFRDRYVRGLWIVADGLVYPMFSDAVNVFNETPFDNDNAVEYYISIDYGIMNPFAAQLWAIYNGVAYCMKEYYYDGRKEMHQRTDEEHYKAIEELAGDKYIEYIVIDPSATSFKATVNRHNRYVCKNGNNEVIAGIGTTSALLKAGLIKFHKSCKHYFDEVAMYTWDSEKPEDTVIKEFDHLQDSTRYFAHTILRREFDWIEWGE